MYFLHAKNFESMVKSLNEILTKAV